MFQFDSAAQVTSPAAGNGAILRLCHWCNRPINSDELIIAIVPRPHDEAAPAPANASLIEEQPWHTVCYGMIQGAPTSPDDD